MRQYSIFALTALLTIACDPIETPTPPNVGGGGEGTDSTFVENDTIPTLPDESIATDTLSLLAMDITFNPADDISYSEIPEVVPSEETDDTFNDFFENSPIEEIVQVLYDGDIVTVTGSLGSVTTGGKTANVVSGVTATVKGAHVEVSSSTRKDIAFSLKGNTTNGSFKIKSMSLRSHIIFDGVSITNPTGAAINIQTGKTMLVHLTDGTTNHLEDGKEYTITNDEQQKGTFFSEGQLIFSGNGALKVKSNYGHGIASDDYIRIRSGEIDINSTSDGIKTKECFVMYGGTVNIAAQQDGLDVDEGYIEIGGGQLLVNAADEGITASYEGVKSTAIDPRIDIRGGLIKVSTIDDKGHGLRAMSTFSISGGIVQVTTKGAGSKALMAEGDMSLTGGKVTAITEGDVLYEEDTEETSSSAAIRSKKTLTIDNTIVGLKSTGLGSKCINNVGNIVMNGGIVKVVATGAHHYQDGERTRSCGISTDRAFQANGGILLIKAAHTPIKAATQEIAEEVTYAAVSLEQ